MQKSKADVVTILFAVLAALWCVWLNAQIPPGAYDWSAVNLWYGSDVGRVVDNMTIIESGHYATFKHPIFSIVVLPVVRALMALGLSEAQALTTVLALNAGLFIWLLDLLCRRMRLSQVDRALVLLLCLASSGFVFWFAVPETFPFGGTSLLLALALITTTREQLGKPTAWALSAFVATSMTITNILMTLGGAAIALWRRTDRFRAILVGGILGMVGLAAVAVLQDQFFGDAGLFFNPFSLLNERQFIGQEEASSLPDRLQTLWLQVAIAGQAVMDEGVALNSAGVADGGLRSDGFWPALPGLAAMAGWVALAIWGLWRSAAILKHRVPGAMIVATAGLFVLSNTVLHLIYGATVFLYLAHFIGPVLLVTAAPALQQGKAIWRALVMVLCLIALYSNVTVYFDAWRAVADVQSSFADLTRD